MTAPEVAVVLFTAMNTVRVFAYVPQILRVARDGGRAEAISCTTWVMFAFSHLSTVAYAILAVGDLRMAAIFAVNMLACLLVLGITAHKRICAHRPKGMGRVNDGGPARVVRPLELPVRGRSSPDFR
jgi:uncharacterized protein with PQ loop repeat